jgi:hypothetical protein
MRIGGTVAVALALAMGGCGVADYVTDSQASVLLIVAAVNGGAPLDSDVRNGAGGTIVCPDTVNVAIAIRNKVRGAPAPNLVQAVIVDRYDVVYVRSDGRSEHGVDVPFPISGLIAAGVDVANSGTTDVPVEVVRRQAKLEPPLSTYTEADIVTMFADVRISGKTVSGQAVSGSGRLQIDFADFVDSEDTCPSQNPIDDGESS